MHAVEDHYADPILDSMVSREINIDNRDNSNELEDYQVFLEIDNARLFFASQDGLRFVDENLQIMGHWNESFPDKVWLEVPKIQESAMCGLRLIECGPSSKTGSNGDDTFDFFDDFSQVWVRQGDAISDVTTAEVSVIYEGNPQILTGETKVFKMWYHNGWAVTNVYYAESIDGKTWTQYGSNPVVSNFGCPHVTKIGTTYYLYGKSATHIMRRHSSNGLSWTDDGNVLDLGSGGAWDNTTFGNTCVWREGTDAWKMLYEAKGSSGVWKLGLATGTNGTTWTKSGSNPVIADRGGGPNCHKIGSFYYLWCHGAISGSVPTDGYRYRSTNLTSWEACPVAGIFSRGTTDEGIGTTVGQVADLYLLEHNGRTYMWYSASTDGVHESGNMHIKFAIADKTLEELILTDENAMDADKWNMIQDVGISNVDNEATLYKPAGPHTAILTKTYQINDGIIETRVRSPISVYGTFIWFRRATNTNGDFPRNSGQGGHGQNYTAYEHAIIVDSVKKANTVITADALWHYYRLIANGVELAFKKFADGSFDTEQASVNYTDTSGLTSGYVGFEPWGLTEKMEIDWVRVRKYASPEPTAELGVMI